MTEYLERLVRGENLTRDQARRVFERIMAGLVDPAGIAAILTALAAKGESRDEIVGAVEALREHAVPVRCPAGAVDTCGTGGDGISTFNVSTTAALIAAGAGAVVAKHGNRTNTRVSGSAEVLDALGVNIDADVSTVERCLGEVGVGFLYARALHPAMKHAAPIRASLGIRTLFNLLGPLANPAGVRRQVVGVPRPELAALLAGVFKELRAEHVWVVCGSGLCDLTVTGVTRVTELAGGAIHSFSIKPEDVGLARADLADLRVVSPVASAAIIRSILEEQTGPCRDQAVLNAAAALVVAGRAVDLSAGVALACEAIDSGAARRTLERLVACSHGR